MYWPTHSEWVRHPLGKASRRTGWPRRVVPHACHFQPEQRRSSMDDRGHHYRADLQRRNGPRGSSKLAMPVRSRSPAPLFRKSEPLFDDLGVALTTVCDLRLGHGWVMLRSRRAPRLSPCFRRVGLPRRGMSVRVKDRMEPGSAATGASGEGGVFVAEQERARGLVVDEPFVD
jgi:hypothetical protein